MAWHRIKARINAMPVNCLVETNGGTLDQMVTIVTSEHGEVELFGPVVLPHPKSVKSLAKQLAKRPKGDPAIAHDSEVCMLVRKTRITCRDTWPLPPRCL